jgi:serine/threonine protein kinase
MSLEGQQIDRYRILRLLGSGGMGEVYLAEDARIEQQVAIKVIRAEASPYPNNEASQEAARLFQREAKAIAKLDHPHILPLFAYGEQRLGNLALIYLVMPYRREGSLSDWLRQRGQAGLLSRPDVAHLVGQAASALQHAHDRQVIHQDVKPSNFLIRHRPEKPERPDLPDLFLADFGIAKFTTATSAMSHTIRGTPTYMAPEQWEGHPVPATDQYALAVMTYELLTGRSPFQGGERQVMYQHLMVLPAPPSTVNSHLSRDIDTVLLHALSKQPEQRFASMTAFSTAFQQAVQAQAAQETAAPPYLSGPLTPPTPVSQGDIRAVLAISTAEAQLGTTRTLTLPGGRKVTVSVPAGARDGQIVRLDGQGETSPAGGPAGALILTLLVKTAEEPSPFTSPSAGQAEEAVLTAHPAAGATDAPPVSKTGQQGTVSNTAQYEMRTLPSHSHEPIEAVTPASQVSPPSTEPALPSRPVVERIDEMTPVIQEEQQASGVPAHRAAKPAETATEQRPFFPAEPSLGAAQPQQRGISRRSVVVGLAGLAVVGGTGGGLLWLARSRQPFTPTPLSVGTVLYTYQGHFNTVTTMAWSPDGRRIASGSHDDTVQVWGAADGGNVFTYRGHSSYVLAVAWSPDGRRIASGSGGYSYSPQVTKENTVQVWDASNGGNVFTYFGHSDEVHAVVWSPDGKHIASGSHDKTVQVWDASTGANVFTYRGHSSFVNAVAWSPDGRRIASGSTDQTVQVWDASKGGNVFTYRGHFSQVVEAVAWSPDSRRIASGGYDNTVQVWLAE